MDVTRERFRQALLTAFDHNEEALDAQPSTPTAAEQGLLKLCLRGQCESADGAILRSYVYEINKSGFVTFKDEELVDFRFEDE